MSSINEETKKSRVWLQFSTMGLTMGLTIYLAHFLGEWLDKNYHSDSINYNKTLTIFAVFGSTYSIIRQVIKMSNDEEKTKKNG